MKKRIISHGGIAVDIETVKCITISNKATKTLVIEHKKRVEFVENPNTGQYEKVVLNDISKFKYTGSESAEQYKYEWEQLWNQYLNETEGLD